MCYLRAANELYMSEIFLSRFTPSLTALETLKAVTVGREQELTRIVELVRVSLSSQSKHHSLIVGPRGIGKTHLISLIFHELKNETENFSAPGLIVRLKEEEWGVASFLDLLLRILRNLAESSAAEADLTPEEVEALYDLELPRAEKAAAGLLKKVGEKCTIVLLAENLSDIFRGLGEVGQQKLRAFIQNHPFFSIVAAAQSLFAGVSAQSEPFYGFFRVFHLKEFSLPQAVEMLTRIAEVKGDKALAAFLKTPEGRARVRAVHHLIGGSPRLYVIFSEFLSCRAIDDLVTPFMKMLDELTPYYQERMQHLSPQQRQIVEILCEGGGRPLTVKEIARRAFITHQTTSGQLRQLRETGYVSSKQIGRESLYELREPLMRLTVEVKKGGGEPIRLLVDFLKIWYSRGELETRLEMLGGGVGLEREYLLKAQHDLDADGNKSSSADPRVRACRIEYNLAVESLDFQVALEIAEDLLALEENFSHYCLKWLMLRELRRMPEAAQIEEQMLESAVRDAYDWYFRGEYYSRLNDFFEAARSYRRAVELKDDMASAWAALTHTLISLKDYREAEKPSERSVAVAPEEINNWYYRGHVLANLGKFDEALTVYRKILEMTPDVAAAWSNMGWLHCKFRKFSEALPFLEKAARLDAVNTFMLTNRGWALAGLRRHEEALDDFELALRLDPSNKWAFNNRGWTLIELDRFDEALRHFDEYVRLDPQSPAAWDGLAQVFQHLEKFDRALEAAEKAIKLDRNCHNAWSVQGIALCILGKPGGALLSLDRAIKYEEQFQNNHQPITLFYKAFALFAIGRKKSGFKELDHAFSHACRYHGINLRDMTRFLEMIYERFEDRWDDFTERLAALYAANEFSHRLGAALIKFLFGFLIKKKDVEKEKCNRWIAVWNKHMAEIPGFGFSNRLFETAWELALTGDEAVLYHLSKEERELIGDFRNKSDLP